MKLSKYLFALFSLFFFLIVLPKNAYAATDINIVKMEYLSNDIFKTDVNTNGESTNGVTIVLEINGDVEVVSVSEATVGLCDTFDYQKSDTKLSITCLENSPKVINGTLAEITANVGNSYSIKVVEENTDLGGLTNGVITNIDMDPVIDSETESQPVDSLLIYSSAAACLILLVVLVVIIQKRKKAMTA